MTKIFHPLLALIASASDKTGFNLIELLLVITTIAILVALLSPPFHVDSLLDDATSEHLTKAAQRVRSPGCLVI